ncbi:MAG: 50S ribosomal protein L24 [Nitrospirae bacterium CG18_big_fil_WC_8_21_14_2_50_70_55]|nr:50S ribosomal protein L24 [Deltaproteobacteria bacterium]PIQ07273.1 MAG: 50S ribosomal protein L24 [Nitrospirae bacterium CG18_big_fil_WC_8_21_14_2_50_70_55]PIU80138.1 MAG: 50S ribosomal protein L24 [Nitrospirae bacterium CG06_land_8_20_14_3_00_70_43]PIW82687.1 MAG: 50S ribosomal protein L24 [Nitrospirae bacterium CG_4_8_14_3_um_filter_70_85]PIX84034.1 MAG: 50S ribosomal protein L24 [Nitrospirae bacterium CG_4_10_14_3_um_filter_70_108]PJB96533.1 MAG: 50S ribosomal protein L24 [Nitrospirae b
MLARVKKGDQVRVIAGKDKGTDGRVLRVDPTHDRVVVERVNLVKRHLRPSQGRPEGGIVEREAALHLSNVVPICSACGHAGRIRRGAVGDKRARLCIKCGEPLDKV